MQGIIIQRTPSAEPYHESLMGIWGYYDVCPGLRPFCYKTLSHFPKYPKICASPVFASDNGVCEHVKGFPGKREKRDIEVVVPTGIRRFRVLGDE
jgi:hypothetical protein